jgi:hypothetical protein
MSDEDWDERVCFDFGVSGRRLASSAVSGIPLELVGEASSAGMVFPTSTATRSEANTAGLLLSLMVERAVATKPLQREYLATEQRPLTATTDGDHNGRQLARRHVVCPPAAARRPRRPRRPSVRPSFEEAGGGGGGRKHIKKEYCTPTCTHSMCRIHLSIHSRFK